MGIFDKKHGGEKVDEAADLPAYERDHSLDVQDGLFENAVRTQLLKLTETTELSSPDVNTSDTPTALLFCTMTYIVAQANPRLGQVSIGSGLAYGGFIRMAGHWVDDALGFMAGWNFFFYEALLIPFEVTALNSVLGFGECKALRPVWRDDIPTWAVCIACIILYAAINILAVRAYGEAEFWLSGGKVILIFLLFAFTFITMVGGNPRHDAYGFR
ncbi:hypothetical protein LTR33_012339 [Friedmanniomyces endolithicus]|nr:hypothetical protein LTR33_012339 [Friedmanniomyces endolithicus]